MKKIKTWAQKFNEIEKLRCMVDKKCSVLLRKYPYVELKQCEYVTYIKKSKEYKKYKISLEDMHKQQRAYFGVADGEVLSVEKLVKVILKVIEWR